MASFSADVVIMGGGLAGFAAALRAAEFGLKPIILEQGADEKYLCNTRIAIGVFQVALHDMLGGAVSLRAAIDEATRGYVLAPLRDQYAAEAGPALRWLMGQGIRRSRLVPRRAVLRRSRPRSRGGPASTGKDVPGM
jgi:succinate dehydrogenase/fumarate reductase flavoprotein subunit